MTSRNSPKYLAKVRAWIETQPTAVTMRMVAAGMCRSEDSVGKILAQLKREGCIVGVRGVNHKGGCSFLYHPKGSPFVKPEGLDFRKIGSLSPSQRRSADPGMAHQVTVKDWPRKPFRHWMDIALFGEAPARSEA